MTPLEQFIDDTVRPQLAPGERLLHMATGVTGGGMSAGGIGAFRAARRQRACHMALTDQRLFLLWARVGAFRPLCEVKDLEILPRDQIAWARASSVNLNLALKSGVFDRFAMRRKNRHVAGQAGFIDAMVRDFGAAAPPITGAARLKTVLGVSAGVAIAIGIAVFQLTGRVHAEVGCAASATGAMCQVRHTKGRGSAEVCWDVVLTCAAPTHQLRAHQCQHAEPHDDLAVKIDLTKDKGWAACGGVLAARPANLEVN